MNDSSPFEERVLHRLHNGQRMQEPVLVLSPHPDDETIGLGGGMARLADCRVLFLTDGAPADRSLWGVAADSRPAYARIREREARRALRLVGVEGSRVGFLPCVDLQSVNAIVPLAHQILAIARVHGCRLVVTTPYEGGHPDHDTAALLASLTKRLSRGAVGALEMASYHGAGGRLVRQRFLPGGPSACLLRLTDEERARKRAMLRRYRSQARTLAFFGPDDEWLRPAPRYDFASPPSEDVYYERLGLPARWTEWSRRATEAEKLLLAAEAVP